MSAFNQISDNFTILYVISRMWCFGIPDVVVFIGLNWITSYSCYFTCMIISNKYVKVVCLCQTMYESPSFLVSCYFALTRSNNTCMVLWMDSVGCMIKLLYSFTCDQFNCKSESFLIREVSRKITGFKSAFWGTV